MEIDKEEGVIHSLGPRKITRQGQDKVVKSGRINLNEASALNFVAANTTIPVPKVHRVSASDDGEHNEIVMDFIPGMTLEKAWESLDHNQKVSIAREVNSYVCQLHRLKGTYIGSVDRGPITVGRYDRLYCGPFDNEKLFNEYLHSRIVKTAPRTLRHYAKACLYENHPIIFTHADLGPHNIMVDERGRLSAIIDWEDSGWYPEYWENYRAMRYTIARRLPDWPDYFHYMLPDAFEREYIGISYLAMISSF